MAARDQSQVIAHYIDSQGTEDEKHSNPEAPVTVRPFPVRTMGMQFVMVTVFYLTHWFPYLVWRSGNKIPLAQSFDQ
jgi:hypothetical protein